MPPKRSQPKRSSRAAARASTADIASLSPPPDTTTDAHSDTGAGHPAKRARRPRASTAQAKGKGDAGENTDLAASIGPSGNSSQAAQDVYSASELMERIYSYCDKPTLAACLKLEKANTATCARYLYHTIPAEIGSKMSRTSARRVVYCDSVRVIDRCYNQNIRKSIFDRHYLYSSSQPAPLKDVFDADAVLACLAAYIKQCPQVIRVEHEHPNSASDATWVVQVGRSDDTATFDLSLHLQLEVRLSSIGDGKLAIPPTESMPGFASVQETFDLVWEQPLYDANESFQQQQRNASWRTYLEGSEKDVRIVGLLGVIDMIYGGRGYSVDIHPWPAEKFAFLRHIDLYQDWFRSWEASSFSHLGDIRKLQLSVYDTKGNAHFDVITSLSELCPQLRELHVLCSAQIDKIPKGKPLTMLRRLHLESRTPLNTLHCAQFMAWLATDACHCSVAASNMSSDLAEYHRLVKAVRSPTAEGQALREGRLADVSNFNFSDAEGTSLVSQATRADASKAFTVAKKEMKQMHASLKQRWA